MSCGKMLSRDGRPSDVGEWRLTVCCASGLANRLKVLTSGLALAEATGREFRMLWPINRRCAAPFARLFGNPWNVIDISSEEATAVPLRDWRFHRMPDLCAARDGHLIAQLSDWLIRPSKYPSHEPLRHRCVELFHELAPNAAVAAEIARFRTAYFRPVMIGVHLRRGDMVLQRPDVSANTAEALAQVERLLVREPDAGILLCTDDGAVDPDTNHYIRPEGLRRAFEQHFGDRVVSTTPRSLDRGTPEAIEDALVDLFLLRQTQMLVVSRGSTFSDLAAYGRSVTAVKCGAMLPGYRRFERLSRISGLYYLLSLAARLRYGRRVSFIVAWRAFVGKHLPKRHRRPWTRF
jgi:hypothetical protein